MYCPWDLTLAVLLSISLFPLASFQCSYVSRQNGPNIAPARHSIASTTVLQTMVFAGGFLSNGTGSSSVQLYHHSTQSWDSAVLSVARGAIAAASAGEIALFAGGYDSVDGTPTAQVDIYNATDGSWSLTSLPGGARAHAAASGFGRFIAFSGGETAAATQVPTVDVFDVVNMTWVTAGTMLSRPTTDMSAATVWPDATSALFSGGQTDSGLSPTFQSYSHPQPQSSTINVASGGLNGGAVRLPASASVDGLVLIGGGEDAGSIASMKVQMYDHALQATLNTTLNFTISGRSGHAGVGVGGRWALFAGGRDVSSIALSSVEVYDNVTGAFTTAGSIVPALSVARYNVAGDYVGGGSSQVAIFAGGSTSAGVASDRVDMYHFSGCASIATFQTIIPSVCNPPVLPEFFDLDALCIDGNWVVGGSVASVNGDVISVGGIIFTIDGTFQLDSNATLVVGEGSNITVTGCADLNGTLQINLTDVPENGTVITDITSPCLSGNFSNVELVFNGEQLDDCERAEAVADQSSTDYSVLLEIDDSECGDGGSSNGSVGEVVGSLLASLAIVALCCACCFIVMCVACLLVVTAAGSLLTAWRYRMLHNSSMITFSDGEEKL